MSKGTRNLAQLQARVLARAPSLVIAWQNIIATLLYVSTGLLLDPAFKFELEIAMQHLHQGLPLSLPLHAAHVWFLWSLNEQRVH